MKLYLVRHGESVANKKDLYHFPQTALNKEGISQSKKISLRFKKPPIDFIYSSDLERARQTAVIISKKIGKKVEFSSDLREFRKPSKLWGKSDDYDGSKNYTKLQKKNFYNPEWKLSDDESFSDLKSRASEVLKNLITKFQDKQILIISHGALIKMLTALAIFGENLTPELFWDFWHNLWIKNTGITVIEYNDGKWTLITWNDMSHFGD